MKWLLLMGLCWSHAVASSQDRIRIGLFDGHLPTELSVTTESGAFEWVNREGRVLGALGKGTQLKCEGGLIAVAQERVDYVCLRPTVPSGRVRLAYPGEFPTLHSGRFHFMVDGNQIRCILETGMETYLQGVLSAESGKGHHPEYYAAQAIVSRTYTVQALDRHRLQGFDLCDDVHCQAYHGLGSVNDTLREAVHSTAGSVVVDRTGRPITAAFHSNCGGHTQGAENVWQRPLNYLVGVPDTFCLAMPHAQWTKTVPTPEWREWLAAHRGGGSTRTTFLPNTRVNFLPDSGESVRAAQARAAFGLQSSFFVTVDDGEHVRFMGQGFGHGVGLCQEGAMERARLGASAADILHHYYRDVRITSMHALGWFLSE